MCACVCACACAVADAGESEGCGEGRGDGEGKREGELGVEGEGEGIAAWRAPPGVFRGLSVSFSLTCCIQWLRFLLAQTTWLPRGIASTHRPSRHRTPSTARAIDRAPTRPLRPGQDEADTEAAGAQAAEGEARCRSASRPPPTQAGSALRLTSIRG